jgi:peptide deformylase
MLKAVPNLTSVQNEVLSAIASPVESPDEAREIVKKLEKALAALRGCLGLAAPQIGISKAVAIIRDPSNGVSVNLVNPKILEESDPFVHMDEGCMSFPGRRFNVPRFKTIRIENYSPYPMEDSLPVPIPDVWKMSGGRLVKQESAFCYWHPREVLGGITMVAIQHEIDHLNGICLPWKENSIEINQKDIQFKTVPFGSDATKLNSGGDAFPKREIVKVGRNAPCPCGSGKKYKKCCG